MRETSFIRQNKKKWKTFEKTLDQTSADPDQLNDVFIQVTDDLSYSRTFYTNRSVRVYLNNLAQQIFYKIYKNKKTRLGRITHFWAIELPQLVHEARIAFRLSLAVFAFAMLVGAFSSAMDPEFPRVILGDSYVEMTLENIESGDPMAVYKQKGQFGMSLGITANNLYVAFLTFVMGAVFAVGSIFIMLSNGIMVGAFQYFFYQQGLLQESFLTIWTHGTLEISAIIIAGAAGITMGKGLVFPGTLTRLQSFQISARRGLKIMIAITPIIIMAGFIEGYLTRHTETPDAVRLVFILICLTFILGYFVWYPYYLSKRGFGNRLKETELPPTRSLVIDFTRIKSSGEIFSDIFVLYRKHFSKVFLTILVCSLVYCTAAFLLSYEPPDVTFKFPYQWFGAFSTIDQFVVNDEIPWLPIINVISFSVLTKLILYLFHRERHKDSEEVFKRSFYVINFLKILIGMTCLQLLLMTNSWYTIFIVLLVSPIIFLWLSVMYEERQNIFKSLGRSFNLLSGTYGNMIGLYFLLLCVSILFYLLMDTSLLWLYFDFISWNLSLEEEMLDQLGAVLLTFSSVVIINLLFAMLVYGGGLLYFSLLEIKDAPSLFDKIKLIGKGRRIQGLERE